MSPDFTAGSLESNPSTFNEISDSRNGFPIIFAEAADSQNEISKAEVCTIYFSIIFFHKAPFLVVNLLSGALPSNINAKT